MGERATADWVARASDEGQWSGAARSRALRLVLTPPNATEWRVFLDQVLLAGGSAFILLGVIFFVAANWAGLGAYSKFLLLDVGILGAAGLAYRTGLDSAAGKWSLTLASGLVGAFLALYGQTYQTGADPYWLFLGWAALIFPWCLAARHEPLWSGWVILLNVALSLSFSGSEWEVTRFWVTALFNLALVAISHFTGQGWLQVPWVIGLMSATFAGAYSVIESRFFERSDAFSELAVWLLYIIASSLYFYRRKSLAELAAVGFSVIFVDTLWLGSNFFRILDGISAFFFLGVFVIVQVSVLAAFLRRLRRSA